MEKKIKNLMLGMMLVLVVVVLTVSVDARDPVITQCNDGIDNDLDGDVDYPADSGCDGEGDLTESIKLGYADGCLVRGDVLMDVFGKVTYRCGGDRCFICVSMTEAGNSTTKEIRCLGLPECGFSGGSNGIGGGGIDSEPLVLVVNSPNDGEVFNSRKVLFDLNVNKESGIYYIDNINGRGRWKRIVSRIGAGDFFKSFSFKDGLNDITIRAKDKNGNIVEVVRSFYVDSKKPRMSKTYPKKGKFASGSFEVVFKEDNPVELKLFYGNDVVGLNVDVKDVNGDCYLKRGKHYCSVDVDLSGYSGEDVSYWFELKDIAGNVVDSKKVIVKVDVDEPVILNSQNFWKQGEGRYAKYIYFNIEIDEVNFDEVSYFYEDSRGRMKEKRLCSRLRDGRCVVKKSFRRGETLLNIQVVDEAGNVVMREIGFEIVY